MVEYLTPKRKIKETLKKKTKPIPAKAEREIREMGKPKKKVKK